MNKQDAYEKATLLSYKENPMGDRMDVIYKAMDIYATEKDLIISGIEEGAENWKAEYDNCRVLLNELVALKELKDKDGKTDDYLFRQPIAWEQAKEFLKDYQHLNW